MTVARTNPRFAYCLEWCGSSLRRRSRPRGLTLLEVMLAIAILGGAMAAIGEIVRIGGRAAEEARLTTTAQLHCESKMAQIVTGVTPPMPVARVPYEADPEWLYSITVQPLQQEGLLAVEVTFEQNVPAAQQPISFSLVRWMIDPILEYEESAASADGSATSGSTGTSSASVSGGGSNG